MLADRRSLEALDFARVRERVAGQTHAARAHALALAMEPSPTGDRAAAGRGDSEMRALIRTQAFSLARHRRRRRGARDRATRCVAAGERAARDRRRAGGERRRRARDSRGRDGLPALRDRASAFRALPAIVTRITEAIDERGTVLDRASPALARTRRAMAQAQDDARERTAALARSARYARAMQDAIVTVRDGRFVIPIKAEFAGEFPGIVHDTSATGQTLFVEPLETLETNNRVRALRAQEEHEVARILAELSALTGAEATRSAADVGDLRRSGSRVRACGRRRSHARGRTGDRRRGDDRDPRGRHPLLDERGVPQSMLSTTTYA